MKRAILKTALGEIEKMMNWIGFYLEEEVQEKEKLLELFDDLENIVDKYKDK